jgi:hypothetical protein
MESREGDAEAPTTGVANGDPDELVGRCGENIEAVPGDSRRWTFHFGKYRSAEESRD